MLPFTARTETGDQALQWLYDLAIKPTARGIQNMATLPALGNPSDGEGPVRRLEANAFYRAVAAAAKK